jgi:hypothetical protein
MMLALMLPGCANPSPISIQVPELVASDAFAGYELVAAEGDTGGTAIGSILNVEEGSIQYVVFSLEYPSILGKPAMIGLSGELVPVPWTLLACDARAKTCSLDVIQRTLERAPRIDWPSRLFDRDLQQLMTTYWSQIGT